MMVGETCVRIIYKWMQGVMGGKTFRTLLYLETFIRTHLDLSKLNEDGLVDLETDMASLYFLWH